MNSLLQKIITSSFCHQMSFKTFENGVATFTAKFMDFGSTFEVIAQIGENGKMINFASPFVLELSMNKLTSLVILDTKTYNYVCNWQGPAGSLEAELLKEVERV